MELACERLNSPKDAPTGSSITNTTTTTTTKRTHTLLITDLDSSLRLPPFGSSERATQPHELLLPYHDHEVCHHAFRPSMNSLIPTFLWRKGDSRTASSKRGVLARIPCSSISVQRSANGFLASGSQARPPPGRRGQKPLRHAVRRASISIIAGGCRFNRHGQFLASEVFQYAKRAVAPNSSPKPMIVQFLKSDVTRKNFQFKRTE